MVVRGHSCHVIVVLLLLGLTGCVVSDKSPLAINGVLDLSAWDFDKDGIVKLDGEWEFYWKRLISPDEFIRAESVKMTDHFRIPGRWDGREIDGVKQTGDGYATFRLNVKSNSNRRMMAVRIKEESSAYRLWINGEEVARNGVVGDSRDAMVPQYLLQVKPFQVDQGSLEFVLQVSNFHHRKGGVWFPIELGTPGDLVDSQYTVWALDLFLFGSLLVMGLYYLFIFLLRRREYSAIYFSLFCVLIAIRTVFTNTRFFVYVFPDFPWEFIYKIELLTVTVTFPVMLMFICSLYPHERSKLVVRCTQVIGATASLFVLLVDARLSSHIVVPFQFVILFLYFYITYVLVLASVRKRTGARIILFGMTIFYATIINDVLASQAIIATPFLASIGMLVLALSQSFGLSKQFVTAFSSVESLSTELEEKNIELIRMDKLKDEFLANTSHELRTPLHGMIGIAESLLSNTRGTGSAGTRNSLELIVGSGHRLAHLVNDILDFLRLKHKDFALEQQLLNLCALTNSVLTLTSQLAKAKSLQLINGISSDMPAVSGDQKRLQQVLYNLVGNSIKYTNQGRVEISAYQQNDEIVVCVSDTGIGIAPDQLEAIFKPFEQVAQPASRHFESSGLGLGISRQLIEMHGGRLSVESSVGEGSRFCFTLPYVRSEIASVENSAQINEPPGEWLAKFPSTVTVPVDTPAAQPSAAGSVARVLLVDDDSVNQQVVINHLSVQGMAVATASSGEDALQRLESGEGFDLVLLDIMMPGMNGYEVCQRLRQRYSAAELPVLMLTARSRLQDLVQGLECGANDYLAKPFAREELLARVNTHLKLGEAHETLRENLRLKDEIKHREQTEQDLRVTQRRLAHLLDAVDDALFAVNESAEICFSNRACEDIFGFAPGELIGRPARSLLKLENDEKLRSLFGVTVDISATSSVTGNFDSVNFSGAGSRQVAANILVSPLELEEETLHLIILRTGSPHPSVPTIIEELNRNRQRLRLFEEVLDGLFSKGGDVEPELRNELKVIDSTLEQVGKVLLPGEGLEDRRLLAVEVMKLSIAYWSETTATTKIELAIASKLWKVYTNEDGWERAQTLDKYLALDTLPDNPRWNKAIATADFVLSNSEQPSSSRERLEPALSRLRLSR